jgi:hypothetical protein
VCLSPRFPLVGAFPAVFENTQSTSGNLFFLLKQYSIHAEHLVVATALQEILLLEEIQGLKRTWTDAILQKLEFEMNFRLKINVKQDRTNQ